MRDGGVATATIADARFAFPLGEAGSAESLVPLLCAGLIGWRAPKLAGDAQRMGLYGFGAAVWAGGSQELPPEPLDAAVVFAPVGDRVPRALAAVRKGARAVYAGIHMSDIPRFAYRLLWEERHLVSLANLAREDDLEFLKLAPQAGIRTTTRSYPLQRVNDALANLRADRFEGVAVLVVDPAIDAE
jgi:propanol-preferring alcohol dehydrogenase